MKCKARMKIGAFWFPCERAKGHQGKHHHLICDLFTWNNKGEVRNDGEKVGNPRIFGTSGKRRQRID